LCGAIFLDGAFEKQIRTMISADDFALLSSRSKRKMMSDWEYGIKRGFRIDAAEHRKWFVDIPGYRGTQTFESEAFEEALALPGGFSNPRPLSQLRISSPFLSSENLRIDPGSVMLKTQVNCPPNLTFLTINSLVDTFERYSAKSATKSRHS
jgi:hypothetical protein